MDSFSSKENLFTEPSLLKIFLAINLLTFLAKIRVPCGRYLETSSSIVGESFSA